MALCPSIRSHHICWSNTRPPNGRWRGPFPGSVFGCRRSAWVPDFGSRAWQPSLAWRSRASVFALSRPPYCAEQGKAQGGTARASSGPAVGPCQAEPQPRALARLPFANGWPDCSAAFSAKPQTGAAQSLSPSARGGARLRLCRVAAGCRRRRLKLLPASAEGVWIA